MKKMLHWVIYFVVLILAFFLGMAVGAVEEAFFIPNKQNTQIEQDIQLMRDLYAMGKKPRIVWE